MDNNYINLLNKYEINGFIVPSCDEFLGEYVAEDSKRLKYLTGFTGSNGLAIITDIGKNVFFTDSRYTVQAKNEINQNLFEIYDFNKLKPWEWVKKNNIKNLGYDPWLHKKRALEDYDIGLKPIDNIVDLCWHNKPKAQSTKIFIHDIKYNGLSHLVKLQNICSELKTSYLILTIPDSICWLLNIRGEDVPFCPIILCYAVISKSGQVKVFLKNFIQNHPNIENVNFYPMHDLIQYLEQIKHETIQIDSSNSPKWFIDNLPNISDKKDPCLLKKACKNKIEIKGAIDSHIHDGVALVKFLYWLEEYKNEVSEIEAAEKLLEYRKESVEFKYPSFQTISAYGSNGAIIHYAPNHVSNKKISNDNLFLVDSGGQYINGTTDVTRTIHLGKPSNHQIYHYSLVLKAHINLAMSSFPIGTTGSQLDGIARMFLWRAKLDYGHGTGHGVGSFLNVHEGPQAISKYNNVSLEEGMILSNEPGYYIEGKYGIRIENLCLIENDGDKFLKFKDLTLVPYSRKLIDINLLSAEEKDYINVYHKNVYDKLIPNITDVKLQSWLKHQCLPM